jgi:hypothetical protein
MTRKQFFQVICATVAAVLGIKAAKPAPRTYFIDNSGIWVRRSYIRYDERTGNSLCGRYYIMPETPEELRDILK